MRSVRDFFIGLVFLLALGTGAVALLVYAYGKAHLNGVAIAVGVMLPVLIALYKGLK